MSVDFLKIGIKRYHYRKQLREQPWLPFGVFDPRKHNHHPKNYPQVAVYGAWTFFADDHEVGQFRGSLHKHVHGNNASLFTFDEAVDAIEQLSDLIRVPTHELSTINAEFGSNVKLDLPAHEYLDRVILHKLLDPKGLRGKSGIVFKHGRYRIKMYLKPFNCIEQLRIEVHIDHRSILQRLGVRTLYDLQQRTTWRFLGQYLMMEIDELRMDEPYLRWGRMTEDESFKLDLAGMPEYWHLLDHTKRYRADRWVRERHDKFAAYHLKGEILGCLKDRLEQSIGIPL